MRTCFLSNIDYLQNWVRAHWPEVDIRETAPDHIEAYDAYLLSEYVKVNGSFFELQTAWQAYLATRYSNKRLGILGNLHMERSSYLQINSNPPKLEGWLPNTEVFESHLYAILPFQSILTPISSRLHSHGEQSFQKLFFEFNINGYLQEIDIKIEERTPTAKILDSETVHAAEALFTLLDKRWEKGRSLFQFLPFFQVLKEYEVLRSNWNYFLQEGVFPEAPLSFSQQVNRYLTQAVSAVTRFYRMEQKG